MKDADRFSGEQKSYFEGVTYRGPDDPVVRAYSQPKVDFIRKHVRIERETRLLDVGCGNGIFTVRFAELSDHVLGIEPSENLLRENPHENVRVGDGTRLDLADGAFDIVFEANVLHHVADPGAVVREMVRVTAGHVVLIEPNRWNPLMALFGVLVREERGLLRSSRRKLTELLERSGARVTASLVTGMITQNLTPRFMLPVLTLFDRPIPCGEYVVLVAEKTGG